MPQLKSRPRKLQPKLGELDRLYREHCRANENQRFKLDELLLDKLAKEYNYVKLQTTVNENQRLSIYMNIQKDIRLHFWLTRGTVASWLIHPKSKKRSQLFRRNIENSEVASIFANPRVHTGKGYHDRTELDSLLGARTSNDDDDDDDYTSKKVGKGKRRRDEDDMDDDDDDDESDRPAKRSRISCQYGENCTDKNCTFEHRCRYGKRCTRSGCRFDHSGTDDWWYQQECMLGDKCPFLASTCLFVHKEEDYFAQTLPSQGPCKFVPFCRRPDCWYDHPYDSD